jgi:hypothetical protein
MYLEVFRILPVISQVRAQISLIGAENVRECAIRAYAPSPTAHNAFCTTSWAKKKNSDMFFQGY